jgi:hypothetical protein
MGLDRCNQVSRAILKFSHFPPAALSLDQLLSCHTYEISGHVLSAEDESARAVFEHFVVGFYERFLIGDSSSSDYSDPRKDRVDITSKVLRVLSKGQHGSSSNVVGSVKLGHLLSEKPYGNNTVIGLPDSISERFGRAVNVSIDGKPGITPEALALALYPGYVCNKRRSNGFLNDIEDIRALLGSDRPDIQSLKSDRSVTDTLHPVITQSTLVIQERVCPAFSFT